MAARDLLREIEARGGQASLKKDEHGELRVNVVPKSLALQLLPDLQRFKPAMIELLRVSAPTPPTRTQMAARVEKYLSANMTPEEKAQYDHAVFLLDHGLEP